MRARIATGALLTAIAALLLPTAAGARIFRVTQTSDHAGACNRHCALREAVIAANDRVGSDRIVVRRGRYELTIAGIAEDSAASGDLDVRDAVTIAGAGARRTVIDANRTDRVFNLLGFGGNSLTLKGVTVTGGRAKSSYEGAGLMVEGGVPTHAKLVRTRVVGNSTAADTSYEGAGMDIQTGAQVTIARSVIAGNETKTDDGGGITNRGELRISRSTIASNRAGNDGGGIASGGILVVKSSTVSGNRAGGDPGTGDSDGAGIYVFNGTATIENSTISGNVGPHPSGDGAGVYADGNVTLINSTIAFNRAGDEGGGIYNAGGSAGLANTIVARNRASTGNARNCGGAALLSGGHNLESANSCHLAAPGDLARADAGLKPLARNGGPTRTHALTAASDAVNHAAGGICPRRDQRGVRRPQGRRCDIGSYERRLR